MKGVEIKNLFLNKEFTFEYCNKVFKIKRHSYVGCDTIIYVEEEAEKWTLRSLNLLKATNTKAVFYDYDIFGNKNLATIKYSDIKIVNNNE